MIKLCHHNYLWLFSSGLHVTEYHAGLISLCLCKILVSCKNNSSPRLPMNSRVCLHAQLDKWAWFAKVRIVNLSVCWNFWWRSSTQCHAALFNLEAGLIILLQHLQWPLAIPWNLMQQLLMILYFFHWGFIKALRIHQGNEDASRQSYMFWCEKILN